MDIKTLKNPPITEALLEIRFNPNKEVTINKLSEFADSISNTYPKIEHGKRQSFELTISDNKEPLQEVVTIPIGCKSTNTQGNRVVMAEVDKFVVSFLSPYTQWSDLVKTSKNLYAKYLEFVPQTEIIRLGMRYINNIKFPWKEGINIVDYINTYQPLPKHKDLTDAISMFESTIVMPHEDIDCTSRIKQTILSPVSEVDDDLPSLPYVLDIDVFQNKKIPSTEKNKIWAEFEKMRIKKNSIFFGTLTDMALKPYE